MGLRDKISEKIEKQIVKWDNEIDLIKAKSEKQIAELQDQEAAAQVKKDAADKIENFRDKINDAKEKSKEVQNATNDKLEKISNDIKSWFS